MPDILTLSPEFVDTIRSTVQTVKRLALEPEPPIFPRSNQLSAYVVKVHPDGIAPIGGTGGNEVSSALCNVYSLRDADADGNATLDLIPNGNSATYQVRVYNPTPTHLAGNAVLISDQTKGGLRYIPQNGVDLFALTPAAGIPARSGTTLGGAATCTFYRETGNSTSRSLVVCGNGPVFNVASLAVSGNQIVATSLTQCGTRYVVVEGCGNGT